MEYIIEYGQSEILYNELIEKQTEIVKRGVLELKQNLNAIKIQKWYKYWKPFQDFKEEYVEEFRLLINLYRSDRKLSFKQKLSYINILKNAWDEFNKYIPKDAYFNKAVIEFIFDCKYENKDSIIAHLKHNKEYYLSNLNHPDIVKVFPGKFNSAITGNCFKVTQNACLNKLYHLLHEESNYIFHLYYGMCLPERIALKMPYTCPAGCRTDVPEFCHTISDLPTYSESYKLINNLIHIFDNTYFPYLIYKFLRDDMSNTIFNYYYDKFRNIY